MTSPRSPFRVLLVDDEPVIRALVPAMLEGEGVEVRCVVNGAQALAEARRFRPDLILLDIVLPGLDGISACRLLKSDPELGEVPVHMLSSRARNAEHVAARKAGADGFIEKPFKAQHLQALVASLRVP